jgi:hypothetical protein
MGGRDEDLNDEAWDVRETFAYFGRAFYMASVLEVGLAHALMFGEFMLGEREKMIATKGKGFDRKQYEADFDAYMDKQFGQTMGQIMRRVQSLSGFDDSLKKRMVAMRRQRNFLAHHYWRERSVQFAAMAGRAEMRAELYEDSEAFGKLDRDIDAAMKTTRENLGIDDEVLEAHSRRMIEKMKAGEPWEE